MLPPITNNLPGLVLFILIIAVALAFLASIGILRLYRGAVLRAMRIRAGSEPVPLETSVISQEPVQAALNIAVINSAAGMPAGSARENLYTDILRGPWRAAAVYAVAGFCFAIVMAISYLAATNGRLSFVVWFWIYALASDPCY